MTANHAIHVGEVEQNCVDQKKQQQQQRLVGTKGARKRLRKRQRLDPSTSTVVVVGAGLAGLSVALSLKRAGFSDIRVYERDRSLEHQKEGYGLTLTYNPKGPLADLGVLEIVANMDCPSRSHYLFKQEPPLNIDPSQNNSNNNNNCNNDTPNDTAVPMGYFGNAFFDGPAAFRRGYGQRGNLRIPRKVLRKILHDSLLEKKKQQPQQAQSQLQPPTADPRGGGNLETTVKERNINGSTPTVYWNQSLAHFRWDEEMQQYHVRFAETEKSHNNKSKTLETNTTVVADLLVAADGIRSAVLQQLYNENFHSKAAKVKEEPITPLPTPVSAACDETMAAATPTSMNPMPSPSIRDFPERYGLRPMGIRLILGIADGIDHPLLRERGFYTVDTHGHRLFTMPYRSDRFDATDDNNDADTVADPTTTTNKTNTPQNRIMWQLSFSTPSNPQTLDSASLREYVLDTFQTWHPPVLDLVRSTPPSGIWGTDLMDRDPKSVYQELVAGKSSSSSGPKATCFRPRLVICGDALHSMSPFKGQGANQALADGPLLAKWLSKSSVDAALTNWWRETLNRTVPVVEASRKAATDWHEPSTILTTKEDSHKEYHGFAGVQPSALSSLVDTLQQRRIGPHLGGDLDQRIRDVISEHGWFENSNAESSNKQQQPLDSSMCETVLKLAADGNTEGLRTMSLPSFSSGGDAHHRSCDAMVQARDQNGRSCLHLSAVNNHLHVCKWLLAELRILEQWKNSTGASNTNSNIIGRLGPEDAFGKTAFDYAFETGNKPLIHLFEIVLRET